MQSIQNFATKGNNLLLMNFQKIMEKLKYKVIKDKVQYNLYCDILEDLIISENDELNDEIELLSLLIEKWDSENNSFRDLDPIELIKNLMVNNNLKSKDMVDILKLSKGTVSKILNYQKGLSKESIRKLSEFFKISQEAFNRPYQLIHDVDVKLSHTKLKSRRKVSLET